MNLASQLVSGVEEMLRGGQDRQRAFATLREFRDKISKKELSSRPFTARKRVAQIYTVIFYAISSILLFLSLFVFLSSPNWFYAMYVGHSWLIKALVGSFGVSLAAAAAAVAFHLRAENEAMIHLSSRIRRRLRQIYWLKATALSRQSGVDSNDTALRLKHLKAAYQDAKAQIDDSKDETNILLRQISRASFVNCKGKEELFNQALNELDNQLQQIMSAFREYQE